MGLNVIQVHCGSVSHLLRWHGNQSEFLLSLSFILTRTHVLRWNLLDGHLTPRVSTYPS